MLPTPAAPVGTSGDAAMKVSQVEAVAGALVQWGRNDLAKARQAARERAHGTRGIALGLYSEAEAKKTIDDTRWSAWLVTWSTPKQAWVNRRRLSGPLSFTDALDHVAVIGKERGLARID